MYRISVTTLEKFRRVMCSESVFDTEEALLESIKGIFKGTPKTRFGGAYHKIIEGEFTKYRGVITADGFLFTQEQAAPAIRYRNEHPHIVNEMNVRQIYRTNYFPIQVTGRVDAAEGLFVRDAKTKFRAPDMHEYMDSCQWKFYLDILKADVFYYDLFEVKRFNEEEYAENKLMPEVSIHAHEPFQCIRYNGMENELHDILNSFLEYVANRKLFQYLKPALQEEPSFF
jgi:hypothetical protein